MLNPFGRPKTPFYDLFDEQAGHVVSCARRLNELARHFPDHFPEQVRSIHEEEHAADKLNHRVLEGLNGTFLPPIPAEDALALTDALDDVIDEIDEASKRFCLYHVSAVEPCFVRLTEILAEAADRVADGVRTLRHSRWRADLTPSLDEIHRLESAGDDVYHAGLSKLFDGSCAAMSVLKWKELYTVAERAIDACESVGHTLERIALNNEG